MQNSWDWPHRQALLAAHCWALHPVLNPSWVCVGLPAKGHAFTPDRMSLPVSYDGNTEREGSFAFL